MFQINPAADHFTCPKCTVNAQCCHYCSIECYNAVPVIENPINDGKCPVCDNPHECRHYCLDCYRESISNNSINDANSDEKIEPTELTRANLDTSGTIIEDDSCMITNIEKGDISAKNMIIKDNSFVYTSVNGDNAHCCTDDVTISGNSCMISINGPMTPEQRKMVDELKKKYKFLTL